MKELLKVAKHATTKTQTETTGSHTLYFHDNKMFAYNNMVGFFANVDADISGSIPAQKFIQLMDKIKNPTFVDTEKTLQIKYGKQKATLRKDNNGLQLYEKIVAIPNVLDSFPLEFLDGLQTVHYQYHSGKLSGVYIENSHMYVVNANDIAHYTLEKPLRDIFWLPKENALLLLKLSSQYTFTKYAVTSSFLYVACDEFTLALKLKLPEQYPIKAVKKILSMQEGFSSYFIPDTSLLETLERIQISTVNDANERPVVQLILNEELCVKSMGSDVIEEHLDCTIDGVEAMTCVIPIYALLHLYKTNSEHKIYVQKTEYGVFFIGKQENLLYTIKVDTE